MKVQVCLCVAQRLLGGLNEQPERDVFCIDLVL